LSILGEWDCRDASDEQRLFLQVDAFADKHNEQLLNFSEVRTRCFELYKEQPFANICDITREYPCLLVNASDPLNLTLNRPCIGLEHIGDGHVDCFGSSDERNILQCTSYVLGRRFACRNVSDICLPYALFCSNVFKCPMGDEKIVCFNKRELMCNGPNDAMCLNGKCYPNARCNRKRECPDGEDEYWCHFNVNHELEPSDYRYYRRLLRQSEQFLTTYLASLKSIDNDSLQEQFLLDYVQDKFNALYLQRQTRSINSISSDDIIIDTFLEKMRLDPESMLVVELPYICNRGIPIKGENNRTHCLCPSSYYGEYCEFHADRISIVTHINLTGHTIDYTVFDAQKSSILISCTFYFAKHVVDRHEFHVYPLAKQAKQKFYFSYPRTTEFRKQRRTERKGTNLYSIRFEAFNLLPASKPTLLAVWQFPIEFEFLPAFRFAKVLRLRNFSQNYSCLHCGLHGKCIHIENNQLESVCICENGWHGDLCEQYDTQCDKFCYSQALCRSHGRGFINGDQRPSCLCPHDRFGPTCHLTYSACELCQNGGSCYLTHDLSLVRPFACLCTKEFYGDYCQFPKRSTILQIKRKFSLITQAMSVQYYDINNKLTDLFLREQQVFSGRPLEIALAYEQEHAPSVILIRSYTSHPTQEGSLLHLVHSQQNAPATINMTVQLASENQCAHAYTLFDSKLIRSKRTKVYIHFKYFHSAGVDSKTLIFKYHELCHHHQYNRTPTICFRDEDYFCSCNMTTQRAQCLRFDSRSDECQFCLSGGRCIRGSVHQKHDFLCLCPRCMYGSTCQFSSQLFGFTLDTLIIKDVETRQNLSISMYILIVFFIFIISVFSNLCNILTFVSKNTRKVGVGNYLIIVSIVNIISVALLFAKIIYILLGSAGFIVKNKTNSFLCKSLSPLLSISTRVNYWLTSLVSIERLCTILFPTMTTIKKPRLALLLSFIVIALLCGAHIHEFLHYIVVTANLHQPNSTATLCLTNFEQQRWSLYNRINVLLHHFAPFLIQVIAITFLIILAARSRAKTVDKKSASFFQILKIQFKRQKELYITPTIIILSALPQIILSSSFACTQLNSDWQRYALFTSYLFSFTPQIFSFLIHVLPSSSYKTEFKKTKLGMILFNTQKTRTTIKNTRQ
jgi:hypothetical protein